MDISFLRDRRHTICGLIFGFWGVPFFGSGQSVGFPQGGGGKNPIVRSVEPE